MKQSRRKGNKSLVTDHQGGRYETSSALFARTQAAGTEYCEQPNDCSIDGCPQEDCYCDSSVNKCLPIESAVR